MELTIAPLDAQRWDSLAGLFSAGGDPKWCWCMYWRVPNASWSNTTARGNRAKLRALVRGDGPAPGLVAERGGEAVGWVGLAPRDQYERLARSRTVPQLPGDAVWSVVCFVVARGARRQGIAGRLLEAAVDYARANGARTVEAYPVDTGGQRLTSASVYTGTLDLFLRAGFEVASDTSSRTGGLPRLVVRRAV